MQTPASTTNVRTENENEIENDTAIEIETDDSNDNLTATETGFAELGLGDATLQALDRAGYSRPSPIQEQLIPHVLEGRDCVGNAPTGSGKTAAFLLPALEKADERDRRPQVLVLVPTRELAHQIGREFERLSQGRRLRAVAIVGGESMNQQYRLLRGGCQFVLATPGRLIDFLDRGWLKLDGVQLVVLDEADQMLDIGFRPAIDRILTEIPAEHQTLLLSATMPREVRELTRIYLKDPVDVRLIRDDEDATVPSIRQAFVVVDPQRKHDLLMSLLQVEQPTRAIVFCRTKMGADHIGEFLKAQGHRAEAMHGDLSQARRNRVLHSFRSGRLTTLVATDVVGRGIDVPGISHVINFDLPEDPEHYVHRIGRTGRMGRDGVAFSFVLPSQGKLLDLIEKAISRTLDAHEIEGIPSLPRPTDHRRGGGRRGPGDRFRRGPGRPGGGGGGGRPVGRRGGPGGFGIRSRREPFSPHSR